MIHKHIVKYFFFFKKKHIVKLELITNKIIYIYIYIYSKEYHYSGIFVVDLHGAIFLANDGNT